MQQITIKSHQDECELLGLLIDCVEDFLEAHSINGNSIGNPERDEDPDAALIYGSDYDDLANSFAKALGIERDFCYTEQEIYDKINLNNRIQDVKNHAENLGIKLSEGESIMLARSFINHYDCNATENDQFENLICQYDKFKHQSEEIER